MKSKMCNLINILLIFLIIVLAGCIHTGHEKVIPRASEGIIDLGSWNFKKDGAVSLDGEWEFYWKTFISPVRRTNATDAVPGYIAVPGRWNDFRVNGNAIGGDGFASYRLVVLLDREAASVAMKFYEIATSYVLFVNGTEIASLGTIGIEKSTADSYKAPLVKVIPVNDRTIEIILHVSNFQEMNGGFWYHAPVIGTADEITRDDEIGRLIQAFLFGCIFMIAFYHLCLFFFRKEDVPSLLFCAFCLSVCLRLLVTGESYLIDYISPLPWECIARLQYASFFLAAPLFGIFTRSIFKTEFRGSVSYVFVGISIVFIGFSLFASLRFLSYVLSVYGALTLVFVAHLAYVITRAVISRREGSALFLVGFCVLVAAVVNDILYHNQLVNTMFLTPWGLFVFIIAQSFIISLKFSDTFEKVRRYSLELEDYSRNLESKVAERTKQLEDATEQKTRMFVHLAHDTKTPLTLIDNCLKKLVRRIGMADELRIVKENFDKLIGGMNDFLDVERFDRGLMVYDHDSMLNLSDALGAKIPLFRETAMSMQLEFSSDIHDRIFSRIDSYAFDRIADNLLDNAVHYTEPGGSIRISLDAKKDRAVLTVEDTGIGMSENEVKHVFEPFFRAVHGKENTRGTGIGLSIVKGIVESVNGKIDFSSVLNEGTKVTIEFERSEDPGKDRTSMYCVEPRVPVSRVHRLPIHDSRYDRRLHTVFVIEDDTRMAAYLVDSMKKKYNVFYARDGRHALRKIPTIPKPSIIVSDIVMGEVGGYELYQRLMKDKCFADIPFVFLTAKASKCEKLKGLRMGAIEYVTKPFDMEELIARMESILGYAGSLRKTNIRTTVKKVLTGVRRKIKDDSMFNVEANFKEYKISMREKQIVRLLFQGKMYKEICSELKVSYNTARNHISHIYEKCSVQSKTELFNLLRKPLDPVGGKLAGVAALD
jgi:two-component system sensor histidine kinase ChiS